MRLALFGNGLAAVLCLDAAMESGVVAEVLVVAPPHGPHHEWQVSLAAAAADRGCAVIDPRDVNESETLASLRRFSPELVASVGYTQILGAEALGLTSDNINFHPSLLPKYRGVAPLIRALAAGETKTGVTAHRMTAEVDRGRVIGTRQFRIGSGATGYELHGTAAVETSRLFAEVLEVAAVGLPVGDPMREGGSMFYKSSNQLNQLRPRRQSVIEMERIVRALSYPLPGAYVVTSIGRHVVDIAEVHRSASPHIGVAVGAGIHVDGPTIWIDCSDGILQGSASPNRRIPMGV